MKYRRSGWWKEAKERIVKFFCGKVERKVKKKRRAERVKKTSQDETSLGQVWKMAISPYAYGTELAVC